MSGKGGEDGRKSEGSPVFGKGGEDERKSETFSIVLRIKRGANGEGLSVSRRLLKQEIFTCIVVSPVVVAIAQFCATMQAIGALSW